MNIGNKSYNIFDGEIGGTKMLEAIALDSRTMIVRAERESDMSELVDFISRKDKRDNINAFLEFATEQRIVDKDFKFNRDDCYDR